MLKLVGGILGSIRFIKFLLNKYWMFSSNNEY